jgi:hypothetical protein
MTRKSAIRQGVFRLFGQARPPILTVFLVIVGALHGIDISSYRFSPRMEAKKWRVHIPASASGKRTERTAVHQSQGKRDE